MLSSLVLPKLASIIPAVPLGFTARGLGAPWQAEGEHRTILMEKVVQGVMLQSVTRPMLLPEHYIL